MKNKQSEDFKPNSITPNIKYGKLNSDSIVSKIASSEIVSDEKYEPNGDIDDFEEPIKVVTVED